MIKVYFMCIYLGIYVRGSIQVPDRYYVPILPHISLNDISISYKEHVVFQITFWEDE